MKVLILGGTGYIGSYLSTHLRNHGMEVECYGNRGVDYNELGRIYLQQFSHIILLAGHSSVQCCDGPVSSPWKNNVRNFKNLVDKVTEKQTIIYASSAIKLNYLRHTQIFVTNISARETRIRTQTIFTI